MKRFIFEDFTKLVKNPVGGGGVKDAFPLGFGEIYNVLEGLTCVALPKGLGETFKVFVEVVKDAIPLGLGLILPPLSKTLPSKRLSIVCERLGPLAVEGFVAKYTVMNLSTYRLNVLETYKTHPNPPLQKEGVNPSLRGAKRRGNPYNSLDCFTDVRNDKFCHLSKEKDLKSTPLPWRGNICFVCEAHCKGLIHLFTY